MLQTTTNRIQGKVIWFNEKRGFGLIQFNDQEIFAHHTEIKTNNNIFKVLYEDEIVEFDITEIDDQKSGNTRICAKNITGINGSKLQCEIKNTNFYKKKHKNTEIFEPSHKSTDMNIVISPSGQKIYSKLCNPNNITMINELFCSYDDLIIYNLLLKEIKESNIEEETIWKLWHGDTHLIADDKKDWKKSCPTFNMIINKIQQYFNMNINATRLNWYKDSSQWKPFHHDAAAVKQHIAKVQNWTVGVSYGQERDIAFQHSKTHTTISLPQQNGSLYAFGNKVNMNWKHSIPQVSPEKYNDDGRISIIVWGWVNME